MPISTIPRTIVKAGLQGLRLPLTAVERLTDHAGDATWAPAVAFESFSAGAKRTLGSVLRDPDLVREGRLQRARVDKLTEAVRLEVEAERRRAAADERSRQRAAAADQARERVDRQAEQRERQLARDKAEKDRRVREAARRKKQAVEQVADVRDEVVTAEERAARAIAIEEESDALAERSEALDAARDVEVLDDAIEAKKAQRDAMRKAGQDR